MGTVERTSEPAWTLPLYSIAEAGRILRQSSSTIRNWASGYDYPTRYGGMQHSGPLITRVDPIGERSVPFTGIAEAYVLTALRNAGLPMQTIRPAVAELEREMGVAHALLSERIKTDGVEVILEYVIQTDPDFEPVATLTTVHRTRDRQMMFREVVEDYLRTIKYSHSLIESIELPFYDVPVVIDPMVNAGRPTIAGRGIRVEALAARHDAGESFADLADDYELPLSTVEQVLADAS